MTYNISDDKSLLKIPCAKFNFGNPPFSPTEFATSIGESLIKTQGVGLAANQIGFGVRCIAIRSNPVLVMYNPKIVDSSAETSYMEEGCLSYPGLIVNIKRPIKIRVRYQTPLGETKTEKYEGMTARVIQHEIDHLDGIIFFDRATLYHREKAFKHMKKNRK